MGERTAIGWTDHTFNPWIGCSRVSPGCTNCYAEARNDRYGEGLWGKTAPRRVTSPANWREPLKWNRAAEAAGRPALVFCASLADVFEDRRDLDEPRSALFELIEQTPHLIWQLLTKRPQYVLDLVPDHWRHSTVLTLDEQTIHHPSRWPSNAWIGTTTEDQQRADERLPILGTLPAPVRFVSAEPLLGPVDLSAHLGSIDWLIAGGESGPGHRLMVIEHAESLRDQCAAADIPFFFKQVGGRTPTSGGDELNGRTHKQFPTGVLR